VEPQAVRTLVDDVRATLGRSAPALIDQEGGRVQRLTPPHWPPYPPGAAYGALYDRDKDVGLAAAHLGARLIAFDLAGLGIDVDCLPIADVPVAGADPVVGDRAYGTEPNKVADIAGAVAMGAPPPTATPSSQLSTPSGRFSMPRILRLFGRSSGFRWR
jgi:beta-N-acetylhexosaminidase